MGLKPVKVSQLNSYIKRVLQTDPILGNVSVIGEVSNLKFHGSGHVYFSLKDENSKVNCFLPSSLSHLADELREGTEITVNGYLYLYERGGSYSLNVRDIRIAGEGELAVRFEKLKKKLETAGYFDREHKKDIPAFPEKVAVITSDTGAAVRDILKIIKNRNDFTDILIYPVLVQGPDAAEDIASAIYDINENHRDVDTIITGRGGGSMEELWAFNEEMVAEAIYRSQIPVISAVGHETDFTIADFVADLRAETPTAAAVAAVPDTGALREGLLSCRNELGREMMLVTDRKKNAVELLDPVAFGRDIEGRIAMGQLRADALAGSLKESAAAMLAGLGSRLDVAHETLRASDPAAIMERGYSIVRDGRGNIVRDPERELAKDDMITIESSGGSAEARITKLGKDQWYGRKEKKL